MMEISLIRHGKSTLTNNVKMTCMEFKNWVDEYDNAGVFEEETYPWETIDKLANAKVVITSDLKRSIQSALLLNANLPSISDPLFREVELPTFSLKLGEIKLKPSTWLVLLRCLWFLGYSRDSESLSDAKIRAKKAAETLVQYGREHKSVVLVGHGIFNRLVGKELQKLGMKGKRRTNSKHWNITIYMI